MTRDRELGMSNTLFAVPGRNSTGDFEQKISQFLVNALVITVFNIENLITVY